jgi:hypothetical protein
MPTMTRSNSLPATVRIASSGFFIGMDGSSARTLSRT